MTTDTVYKVVSLERHNDIDRSTLWKDRSVCGTKRNTILGSEGDQDEDDKKLCRSSFPFDAVLAFYEWRNGEKKDWGLQPKVNIYSASVLREREWTHSPFLSQENSFKSRQKSNGLLSKSAPVFLQVLKYNNVIKVRAMVQFMTDESTCSSISRQFLVTWKTLKKQRIENKILCAELNIDVLRFLALNVYSPFTFTEHVF